MLRLSVEKTDKKDAKWIACLFKHNLVAGSFMPPVDIRQLCDHMRNYYLHLKKRRGHKKAIIAIARMFLTVLYRMLNNGENYNAELYRKSVLSPVDHEITVEQALMISRNQGCKIKSATA